MNTVLSPLVSRLVAALLLIAALFAVWAFVVEPVRRTRELNAARLAQARELIARYERVAATRQRLQQQAEELRRRAKASSGYLDGASPALAAAALQNRLKRIVTHHGGTIRSSQMLSPKEEKGLQRVPVRIQLSVELPALQSILHDLESGPTYLFLDDLNIRAPRVRASRRARTTETSDRMLTVRVDLYGYIRPPKS